MGIVIKALQEILGLFVEHGVKGDLGNPILQLWLGGEFAKQKEIGNLEVSAILRELLDGVAAIAQDALIAVDEVMALWHEAVFKNAGS